jgi:N-methylhydantoinase A
MIDLAWAHIGVDVGGTFTDFSVALPRGIEILHKMPSTPDAPDRAIIQGLRELLADPRLLADAVGRLAHGTTVGTNALIQRRIGTVGMVTTRGFRDLLEIARQTRPRVYDLHEDHPRALVPRHLRLEVGERMRADGTVHLPLPEPEVQAAGRRLAAARVDCIAVCFLHAHAYPAHERRAAEILRTMLPGTLVIASHEVHPEFREYERCTVDRCRNMLITLQVGAP